MSETAKGLRIGVAGGSGTLGREVLSVLSDRRFPATEIIPFATESSIGAEVDFGTEGLAIEPAPKTLRGLDLLMICSPVDAALDLVRAALHEEVTCVDCSGAMAASDEVPLYVADLCSPELIRNAPVIASPAGVALAWSHVLAAIEGAAGIERVVGSVLYSASRVGRAGIEALSTETLSLLNQQDAPPQDAFPSEVAFDCFAIPGDNQKDGAALCEHDLVRDVRRLVAKDLAISASAIQVPTFAGDGSSLSVQTKRPISLDHTNELFEKAPGLEVRPQGEAGPSTRETAGRDVAVVGRVRSDPSIQNGLLLWVAADTLRLAAVNAVKIAETRLGTG
jgi:aspartate-semialdehyde dehydrogenase